MTVENDLRGCQDGGCTRHIHRLYTIPAIDCNTFWRFSETLEFPFDPDHVLTLGVSTLCVAATEPGRDPGPSPTVHSGWIG